MKISDFLSSAQIMIDLKASDKGRLLSSSQGSRGRRRAWAPRMTCAKSPSGGAWIDRRRERRGASACAAAEFKSPFGLLARLRQKLDFDAIDGEPVDIVVLLVLPEQAMAQRAMRRLRRPRAPRYGNVTETSERAERLNSLNQVVDGLKHRLMGCRLLASNPGACRTLLVRDGTVLAPHKDLPLLPAFPRCTLCTTRPQQLDADTCPAYGRVLQIGTHILHALPLFQTPIRGRVTFSKFGSTIAAIAAPSLCDSNPRQHSHQLWLRRHTEFRWLGAERESRRQHVCGYRQWYLRAQ